MSRLKIWDAATGNWQYAGSVDPVALANDPAFRNALAANATLIAALQTSLIPAATIWATGAATPDPGWIFLDGSTIANANTLYPSLWGRIPGSWKSGTSLLVPDMRGRAIIAAGQGAGLTNRTLGIPVSSEESHLLTAAESGMPAHTPTATTAGDDRDHSHTFSANTGTVSADHTHSTNVGDVIRNVGGGFLVQNVASGGYNYNPVTVGTTGISANHVHGVSGTTSGFSTGHLHAVTVNPVSAVNASAAHNIMQPSYVLNYQMKVH